MKSTLNRHRYNNLMRGIQTSIKTFKSQGHTNIFFTAQFFRAGRKQNGIERGDLLSFRKQINTYVESEEADSARIEFFSESTGKSIYSKAITDLRVSPDDSAKNQPVPQAQSGLGSFMGFGEAEIAQLVDRKVTEYRREDELQRLMGEVSELRGKNDELKEKNRELESSLSAKNDIEYYSGIIGTAFPGLVGMLQNTPLSKAANFLAGMGEPVPEAEAPKEAATPLPEQPHGDHRTLATMINEFCALLNHQELSAVELIFMAFEKDRNTIQSVLLHICSGAASPSGKPSH